MANANLLAEKLSNSGITKCRLCEKMGISRPRLDTILKSPETATVCQADVLSYELRINSHERKDIFMP